MKYVRTCRRCGLSSTQTKFPITMRGEPLTLCSNCAMIESSLRNGNTQRATLSGLRRSYARKAVAESIAELKASGRW